MRSLPRQSQKEGDDEKKVYFGLGDTSLFGITQDQRRHGIIRETAMRLTAPSFVILTISLACGVFALLRVFGIVLIGLPISGFWLMTIAWGVMVFGVLFRKI